MCYCHRISYMILTMILLKSYVFGYDIMYLWFYSWYHCTFHMTTPMISVTYDIYAVWYHTFRDIIACIMAPACDISPISWHLGDVMALVGGATRQPLLLHRPRRHGRQRTGDGCWADRRRTWSNYLVIVCFTLRLTVTGTPPPWAWVRAARQTQTRSCCHCHGDWKQAYQTPIIIMAAVVHKPWRYTSARALTTP